MPRRESREVTAIVVGRQDYGEADRIVRLLSPAEGRLSMLLRGARRKHGAVDVGARIQAELRHGGGDLDVAARVDVEDGRPRLRAELGRLATAVFACELCGAFARPGHPEPRLYGLLETTLLLLEAADGTPGSAVLPVLEAKVLTFAGVAPMLDRCAVCGRAIDDPLRFSSSAGGVVHAACGGGEAVTARFIRALDAARRAPLAEVLDGALPDDPGDVPWSAVCAHLGRELPSRAVVRSLSG